MKEYKSFYNSIDNRKYVTWYNYTQRIDTYGCGCTHDCDYCYAKSLLDFRGKWNKEPSRANLSKIKSKIRTLPKDTIIKLGGLSDCFQSRELEHRLTFETIKILNKCKINYLIVTKGHIVANDEYLKIYDKNLAHFQITITTTNDKMSLKHETASVSSQRIYAVEKLNELGFDTSVRLSPFIEGFINYDVLNNISCDKILIEFLKVNHFIKKWFKIDYSEYIVEYGGYRHLPLYKKIALIKNITGFNEVSVGEFVRDHYLYFRDNLNYNKSDCCNLNLKHKYKHYEQLELW